MLYATFMFLKLSLQSIFYLCWKKQRITVTNTFFILSKLHFTLTKESLLSNSIKCYQIKRKLTFIPPIKLKPAKRGIEHYKKKWFRSYSIVSRIDKNFQGKINNVIMRYWSQRKTKQSLKGYAEWKTHLRIFW